MSLDLSFNPAISTLMHLDINSCFATIEQQANPFLRGKPIAVAAYVSPRGCILAASVEAKKLGVKTGMRVVDGQHLCPDLIVLPPDPDKYRYVHQQLEKLLWEYSTDVTPKSIDEFVVNFKGFPSQSKGLISVAQEIKSRIKTEIGDWITVSVGIGPNRYLAKIAAGLHKPDGLDEINLGNYQQVYSGLSLTQLTGIKSANAARLNSVNIYTVLDFYNSSITLLKSAFHSITGYYWYLRLHGWEIDDIDFKRQSFGNMFSLPQPFSRIEDLSPILHKLIAKSSFRMRQAGYSARGVHLAILYRDRSFWHHGHTSSTDLFDPLLIFQKAYYILGSSPYRKPVANLAIALFNLSKEKFLQLGLFEKDHRRNLVFAIDNINQKWGSFVISPASMLYAKDLVPDRIAFGQS